MTKPVTHVRIVCLFTVLSVILRFSSSACSGHHDPKYDTKSMAERYTAWLKKYGRRYAHRDEWNMRFGIYQSNVQFIDSINSQDLPYKLADNQFADMTNQEYRAKYLGYKRNDNNTHWKYSNSTLHHYKAPPPSVDWRKKGAVNPVRAQGECGSCWAFSTIASIEAITQIKTGKLLHLSEQALVDCNIENEGCRMGYPTKAYEFIIKNGGIPTEKTYPYAGGKGNCDANRMKDHTGTITDYISVPVNDESAIEAAAAIQPIVVVIDSSSHEFQFYKSGMFTANCGTNPDHVLIIVGYDAEKGGKYWIMRNSWGADWGEDGYIRMPKQIAQEEGKCGLATSPSHPVK